MSVRLDQVPPLALQPSRPRGWFWLGALPLVLLLLALGFTFLLGTQSFNQQPWAFWGAALGAPLLGWCLLSFGRALLYLGQQQVADGWDAMRDEDFNLKIQCGRRVQQVLGISLYTALRESGALPNVQLNALLDGRKALKAQPSREGKPAVRHSQVVGDRGEKPEGVLLQLLIQVLADLEPTLEQLPDEKPLALLLEVDSALPENLWQSAWQQAWLESGIRQSTVPVEGSGLGAVDQWLDQRIGDQALLLVIAFQFDPQQPEGTAEAAVGLLFGNRLTQIDLPPIAYLHRPEQEREPTIDAMLHAARQALDWVPLDAQSIAQTWRAGIDVQRDEALAKVLGDVPLPAKDSQGFYNLDTLLGHPGKASPWLAIAAATQNVQSGAGPQFILSGGGSVDAGLWNTVLMPLSPLSQ